MSEQQVSDFYSQQPLPNDLGRVHFIGAGGAGMSGIARLFAEKGCVVSGSDRSDSDNLRAVEAAGATVWVGHDAAHVHAADTVVVTSAVHLDNPELQEAASRGVRILHRSQALAWLTRGHRTIAVAGAHGKSTSTGMLITALQALGHDPSFVNGAIISQLGTNAHLGTDDLFVIEADESDGSFLRYATEGVLITNIDTEHLDHYGNAAAIEEAFVTFAATAQRFAVVNGSDPLTRSILPRLSAAARRLVTFGDAGDGNDVELVSFTAAGWHSHIEVARHGAASVDDEVELIGRHNAVNAIGVATVLAELGFDFAEALLAAGRYRGTARRFDRQGEIRGVTVVDDYAHHPTEVAAVLRAARELVAAHRVIAIFEPHLFSRTRDHAREFVEVFEQWADLVEVVDICAARETPIPGITAAWMAEQARGDGVRYAPSWDAAVDAVVATAQPGDVVLTLGVQIYGILPRLMERLHG